MLFEKEFDPITFTEELAMAVSNVNMKLQIYKPGESGPELVDTIEMDLSQFLYPSAAKIEAYYAKFQPPEGSGEEA